MLPSRFLRSMNRLASFAFAPLGTLWLLAPHSVALASNTGAAQDEMGETSEAANTRRTFTPEDFARFAPRSALDMAQQIPGFSIRDSGGDRGLGQADTNVLINGQRISGKSNGPVAALQRIPVDEVVRLELVDGASLDVGGLTGQVLNVITSSSGGISGQYRYSLEWRSFGVPLRFTDGQISLAGGGENTEWTLSFENDAGRRGNEGIEEVFDAAGSLIDLRDEQANFDVDSPQLSGSFARTASNGNILNVNGQVGGFIFRQSETSQRTGIIDPSDRFRLFESSEDEFNFELGGDYSFALGRGRLKLIGFYRYEDSPTLSSTVTTFDDGRPAEGSRFIRDADEGETIIRGEYSIAGLGGDLQFALEGVRNFLEIESELESLEADGAFVPIEFDGASSRVDEDRAEATVTYSRRLAPNLQFQFSGGGEYSQLSQTGEQGLTRSFFRPQGFVSFDWKANNSLNLSGRVERVVGQLNFFDFIASTNLDEDNTNVTNANLVPPQSWLFEAEATKTFGDVGSLTLSAFYESISDIVDQIPIEGGGEAPGNLPSASTYGAEGELTLLFDPIGIKGMRFDGSLRLAEGRLDDPLTGERRNISNFNFIRMRAELRQDFVGTPWAVGAAYRFGERRPNVRLSEIGQGTDRPGFGRVFVEHKDVFGMTARFRLGNLLNQRDRFERTIFDDRTAGLVNTVELRDRRFGIIYSFDIEGSF